MAVPPQMPTPPPMPKFNAQNVKLNQMRGFNPLQAANNMGLGSVNAISQQPQMASMPGSTTPPPMPGAHRFPYAGSLIGSSYAGSSPSSSYAGTKQGGSTAGSRADGIRSKNSR